MMPTQEQEPSGPGIGAALVAFALFGLIVVASVLVDRQRGGPDEPEFAADTFNESVDGARVEMVAVMRQSRQKSAARAFRTGKMVTIAGNGAMDLTGATMGGDQGQLEVVVIAGHAQVRVPPDWEVVSGDSVALGRIQNLARRTDSAAPRKLHLKAVVLAGALDVTH
jgi:hypothetical protein